MNDMTLSNKTATLALVGVSAALASGQAFGLGVVPVYSTSQSDSSYSFVGRSLSDSPSVEPYNFSQDIASEFATLSKAQEPLGTEFEAAWDDNLDRLYQP